MDILENRPYSLIPSAQSLNMGEEFSAMSELNIEQIIREAMQEGKFDHLEGKGKPLHLNPGDDLTNLAFRLVKEAGFAPEWVELAKQIEAGQQKSEKLIEDYTARRAESLKRLQTLLSEPQPTPRRGWIGKRNRQAISPSPSLSPTIAQFNAEWERTLSVYCAELHCLNRLIDRFNYIVPVRGRQKKRVNVKETAAAFAVRFPRLSPLTESAPALRFEEGAVDEQLLQPPPEEPSHVSKPRDRLQAEALEKYVKMRKPRMRT